MATLYRHYTNCGAIVSCPCCDTRHIVPPEWQSKLLCQSPIAGSSPDDQILVLDESMRKVYSSADIEEFEIQILTLARATLCLPCTHFLCITCAASMMKRPRTLPKDLLPAGMTPVTVCIECYHCRHLAITPITNKIRIARDTKFSLCLSTYKGVGNVGQLFRWTTTQRDQLERHLTDKPEMRKHVSGTKGASTYHVDISDDLGGLPEIPPELLHVEAAGEIFEGEAEARRYEILARQYHVPDMWATPLRNPVRDGGFRLSVLEQNDSDSNSEDEAALKDDDDDDSSFSLESVVDAQSAESESDTVHETSSDDFGTYLDDKPPRRARAPRESQETRSRRYLRSTSRTHESLRPPPLPANDSEDDAYIMPPSLNQLYVPRTPARRLSAAEIDARERSRIREREREYFRTRDRERDRDREPSTRQSSRAHTPARPRTMASAPPTRSLPVRSTTIRTASSSATISRPMFASASASSSSSSSNSGNQRRSGYEGIAEFSFLFPQTAGRSSSSSSSSAPASNTRRR